MKRLLLTICLSLTFPAWPCSTVNLYADKENPLNKIPIYDQDGDGSCYAYTAAQMIDYYNLKKNPHHKLTSALWVAFAHKFRNSQINQGIINFIKSPRRFFAISNPNELGFSDISVTLNDIYQTGICDIDVVKDSLKNFKLTDKLTDDEFLYLFNLYDNQLKSLASKDQYIKEADIKRIFDIALNDLIEQRDYEIFNENEKWQKIQDLNSLRVRPKLACGPETPSTEAEMLFSQVTSVFSVDKKNRQLQIIREQILHKCFEDKKAITKVDFPRFFHIGEMWASNNKILSAIDEALDNKEAPAGVGHCAEFYENPEQTPPVDFTPKGIVPGPRVLKLAKESNVEKCVPHYALVVGRRNVANSCQYMIRNTYGSHFWNEHLDCLCEKDGNQFDCNYKTHGNQELRVLGCWVKSENLAKSSFSVTYFDQ